MQNPSQQEQNDPVNCQNPRFLRQLGTGQQALCLKAAAAAGFADLSKLPRSLKVIAEDMLWRLPEEAARAAFDDLASRRQDKVVSLAPGRALLQDFLGIPLMTDLATMRDLLDAKGLDPARINPEIQVDFVVDHSLVAFHAGSPQAAVLNRQMELERNRERFEFIKWCQTAFGRLRVIPPGQGIMHQVNLEWLATVAREVSGALRPDTMIGTDSHTTMVNALGVLGWGVGGIEAEMAMLGLPIEFRLPRVVGIRVHGRLAPGVTATDLVLHMAEFLRGVGVVGDFVEFFGSGVTDLAVTDRATIANMAPEYGATCAYFPIDDATIDYLHMTGRSDAQCDRVRALAQGLGLWQDRDDLPLSYDSVAEFDLALVTPCLAGPTRPDQRVPLADVPRTLSARAQDLGRPVPQFSDGLHDGAVTIAAITSCTNTSNPALMMTAGLLARNAIAKGLRPKPWVKTSLAPGSRVVTDYLDGAGLSASLDSLGFQTIGYGCSTCNGNSGPLAPEINQEIDRSGIMTVAVLSGNRNFEGRIHPKIKAAYLASPPLVIVAALTGSLVSDLAQTPLGTDPDGKSVMLADIWPEEQEVDALVARHVTPERFAASYGNGLESTPEWDGLVAHDQIRFNWDDASSFIRPSPFPAMAASDPTADPALGGLRTLLVLGDRTTTDHIAPNGAIRPESPAARYLLDAGVDPDKLSNYGLRRGNPEVCLRGMFDNPLLQNQLVAPQRGNLTRIDPDGPVMSIFEAAQRHIAAGDGTIIVAGHGYGAGSSRDWAAKGLRLLGVHAVLAQSFERIHRANLVGMGVLPLTLNEPRPVGLDGSESWQVAFPDGVSPLAKTLVRLRRGTGQTEVLSATLEIHSPAEIAILRAGGVLPAMMQRILQNTTTQTEGRP